MSLIALVVTLIVVGLLLWAINAIIPMEPTIKRIVNVVVIVAVVLWLLEAFFGVFGLLGSVRIGPPHR